VVLAAPTGVQPVGTLPDPVRLAALASLPSAALPTVGAAGSSPVSLLQGVIPVASGSVVNGAQNSTGLAQPRSTLPGAPGRLHDPFLPAIDSNLLWEALANDLPLDGAV